jgi:Ca-activated chloride channel homolog
VSAEFLHPERLWWLVAIPFVLLIVSAAGSRRRPLVARLASVLLRSALLALPVYALAGPQIVATSEVPPRVDVLLDASRSVEPAARAQFLATAASWRRDRNLATRVAAFGEAPRLVDPDPGTASREAAAGDLASDPNPALALLRLLAAGPGAIVLFTDGQVEPPEDFVKHAGHRPAFVVPAAASPAGDVRLEEVRAVRGRTLADETVLEVRGTAAAAAKGSVRVLLDGVEVRTHPANVEAGPFTLPVSAGAVPPGRHVACVWFDAGDAEPLDDELGLVIDVPAAAQVLLVAPEGPSLVSAALKAQGIEHGVVTPPDVVQRPDLLDRPQVLVLDRMAVDALSAPEIHGRIASLLARGGGVLFVPRENEGELVPGPARKFLDLLPFAGRPLEPKKKDPPPEKPPLDESGLKPPEPEKKKVERRQAPTLGLLLLIDSSSSMKGQSLRLAKEAAIATAEVLHPEDRIGVVAFNDEPLEVLPMMRAGEKEEIADRIARIKADGGTDFGPALDQAREIFRSQQLQIKHCVLLSDGYSRLGGLRERVETLVREGVTLSTVGVGDAVDVGRLSEMAATGRGKYHPAYTADQIPQILTIEAERVVTTSGARRPFEIEVKKDEPPALPPPAPPKPDPPKKMLPPEDAPRIATPLRAGWPAAYLKGVHPELAQGIFEWHKVDPAPHAWVSVATKDGDPIALHTYAGFGRLVALTVPMQGPAAGPLANWDDFANFVSQVGRFLTPATRPERLQLRAEAAGRAARLEVVDVERKPGTDERLRFEFRDQRGRPVPVLVRRAGPGVFDLEVSAGSPAAFVDVTATVEGEPGSGNAAFPVGLPPEVARRGPDLRMLERWSEALGGSTVAIAPKDLDLAAARTTSRQPASSWWLLLLVPLFLADLALKRIAPGSFE